MGVEINITFGFGIKRCMLKDRSSLLIVFDPSQTSAVKTSSPPLGRTCSLA